MTALLLGLALVAALIGLGLVAEIITAALRALVAIAWRAAIRRNTKRETT